MPIEVMNYDPRSGEIVYRLAPSKEEGATGSAWLWSLSNARRFAFSSTKARGWT